jgi:hypothetical protein
VRALSFSLITKRLLTWLIEGHRERSTPLALYPDFYRVYLPASVRLSSTSSKGRVNVHG